MRTATVQEVTAAIDAAAKEAPGGAIAFDGDGTLWAGDIGEDFFDAIVHHGPHESTSDALAREATEHGLDAAGDARTIAQRIHAAYLGNQFPEDRMCEIVAWVAGGWKWDDLQRFCADTLEKGGLRGRLHGEAIAVVEHARKAGIDVFLVSASPYSIVEAAANVVGIPLDHVAAVRERIDGGVVQCAVIRPIPYAAGKVTNLRAKLGASRPLYAAFGDNAFDVAMLSAAKNPVAVRPKQRLLERADQVPGLVVLERV